MMEDQLQGLIIPAEDAGFNGDLWLGGALLLCLLILAVWRWHKVRHSSLVIAQNKLQKLIKNYSQDTDKSNSSQQTALDLVSILCQGFTVKRLDQVQTNDNKKWQSFHKQLNSACYSVNSDSEITNLLNEAKVWLTRK